MNDELIFEKSKKNMRLIYDRIHQHTGIAQATGNEKVLFLAIGGYNRTYELLVEMGLEPKQIYTDNQLNLVKGRVDESHGKTVFLMRKVNYITKANKSGDYSFKTFDVGKADDLEEDMLVYKDAQRKIGQANNKEQWIKPSIVILDDPSLNLQTNNHRFFYQNELGFAQVRKKNANPKDIIEEIKQVEPAKKMMFALYQTQDLDEELVIQALDNLNKSKTREDEGKWLFKPTEFKKIIGDNSIANDLKEVEELKIEQLPSNQRFCGENARWIIVPEEAFSFSGYDYMDEEDLFEEELAIEQQVEEQQAEELEGLYQELMGEEFNVNTCQGVTTNQLSNGGRTNFAEFLNFSDVADQKNKGTEFLSSATTEEEYQEIKKTRLIYFLDGYYKNDIRNDDNYIGGKVLVSIDVDNEVTTREEIVSTLDQLGLFGLIYPTAKHYFNQANRWRIIMLADKEMNKEEYKHVVEGVSELLDIEVDEASKKLSQLMGIPFNSDDVSITLGSKVSVKQFQPRIEEKSNKVTRFPVTNAPATKEQKKKTLLEFDHDQARLLRKAALEGIPAGSRNTDYFSINKFLTDTLNNPDWTAWHDEAKEWLEELPSMMARDGLDEKEIEQVCRQA